MIIILRREVSMKKYTLESVLFISIIAGYEMDIVINLDISQLFFQNRRKKDYEDVKRDAMAS